MNNEEKQQSCGCIHDDCELLSPEISSLFDRNHVNIESHQLIWLDNNRKDDFVLHQLRMIVDYVKTFNSLNECEKYIEKTNRTTTFLITSGLLGQQILPHIHKYDHIRSVFIFCKNKHYHQECSSHFAKVKNICTEFNELLIKLSQDVNDYLKRYYQYQFVEFQTADGIDDSLNSESYRWLSHLVDFLSWIPYSTDYRQQLIDALKTYYQGNTSEMMIIEEFEKTYSEKAAIQWYTRPTFLFRLLNKALRQHNIPVIFIFGFFLRDLHNQLKEECEKYRQSCLEQPSLKVYRGQCISRYEIEKLNNTSLHAPMVINSFLSTTTDRAVSMLFLDPSHEEDEMTCILFEIEINFDRPCRPFADISHFSHIPDEQEVLFSIGTIFRREEMRYDESDRVWILKLTLHDRIRIEDSAFVMKKEHQQLKEKLLDFIDITFNSTFEQIDVTFKQIMRLFPSEKWITAIKYSCLGERYWFNDNNDEALRNNQQAVHIWLNYLSDDELNSLTDIGDLYERIAKCYLSMKNSTLAYQNFGLAICYYDLMIEKAKTMPLLKACLYYKCDCIYQERGKIGQQSVNLTMAIKYCENELAILLECFPFDRERIRSCYKRLGAYYYENSDYCQAFKYCESALNMHLQEKELSLLSIYDISQELVEICSKEKKSDANLMLKYQLLAHKHLLLAYPSINRESQRKKIAASHNKLSDLYKASNQPDMASEHQSIAEELKIDSKMSLS